MRGYHYSILQYRPSEWKDELVNIAAIVQVLDTGEVFCKGDPNLPRLRRFFPEANHACVWFMAGAIIESLSGKHGADYLIEMAKQQKGGCLILRDACGGISKDPENEVERIYRQFCED